MKIDIRDIYEQLGNIFYAIATGQRIAPLEVAELKLLVTREWLPREQEREELTLSDEAHCILITIDTLQAGNVSPREAYNAFARFYTLHPEIFTAAMKEHILDTAREIKKIFPTEDSKDDYFNKLENLLMPVYMR